MVTALQLHRETSCLAITRELVLDSNRHLRRVRDQQKVQITLFDSLKQQGLIGPKMKKGGKSGYQIGPVNRSQMEGGLQAQNRMRRYEFESGDDDGGEDVMDVLNQTADSDMADYVLARDVSGGQIMFGDVDNLNSMMDFKKLSQEEGLSSAEHIVDAQRSLCLAWSLAASHAGMWTLHHEDILHNITHNLVRLFTVLLHSCPEVLEELDRLQPFMSTKTSASNSGNLKGLQRVLLLLKTMMNLLQLDSATRHLMVGVFAFVHSSVDFLLRNKDLQKQQARIQTTYGAYLLLRYCDASLAKIYSISPRENLLHCGLAVEFAVSPPTDLYTPSILVPIAGPGGQKNRRSVQSDSAYESEDSRPVDGSLPKLRGQRSEVQPRRSSDVVTVTESRLEPQARCVSCYIINLSLNSKN